MHMFKLTSSQLSITWSHINDKEVIMSLMGKSIIKCLLLTFLKFSCFTLVNLLTIIIIIKL